MPSPTGPLILVVDDEAGIVEAVTYALKAAGFRTLTAADGPRALELARRERPDLITLDVMLPGVDGWEVCRSLKRDDRTRRIPIIMLSVKAEEADRVVGLELGADDYLPKPFSPRELVSRIKAILRRTASSDSNDDVLRAGLLQMDLGRHQVRVGGRAVELTSKEFDLLAALLQAKGRVLSREFLLNRVWGLDQALEIETRTVDVHVGQLRKKLNAVAGRLVTVKHVGYRFDLD